MDLYSFVCEQIEAISNFSHVDSKGAWIKCPYHAGGQERTASLVANIYENGYKAGSFYCFGCHEKGNWNKLAAAIGAKGFELKDQTRGISTFSLKGIGEREATNRVGLPLLKSMLEWPASSTWRSISPETMLRHKARLSKSRNEFCVYFPVIIHQTYVGGIYAHLTGKIDNKNWRSKYLNTPGSWSHSSLFGYEVAEEELSVTPGKPLWLVEGPRDALSLYDKGATAVSLLGSNVSVEKVRLIEALDPDIVLIATDADEAGRLSGKALKKILKEKQIPCKTVKMEEGTDPAQLSKQDVINVENSL